MDGDESSEAADDEAGERGDDGQGEPPGSPASGVNESARGGETDDGSEDGGGTGDATRGAADDGDDAVEPVEGADDVEEPAAGAGGWRDPDPADPDAVGETDVAADREAGDEADAGPRGDGASGEGSGPDLTAGESDRAADERDGGAADDDGGDEEGETEVADDDGREADEDAEADDAGGAADDEDDVGTFRGNPALEGRTGPEDDREMPLAEHIEEMVKRLAVVIAVAGLVSVAVFPVADQVVNFLWYSIMPGVPSEVARPRLYGILEKFFTELKVASLAGLIVALPVLVYETYAFMRPGLYPHERRYYLAAVPTSLVLAIVGVSFAYFIVLPAIFVYFLYYSQDVATIGFALGRTFDLILLMMGYLAVVFQIPLFIMLAMMMGLVTRRWLADRRLLFWGAFLGISFLFGFDPTGMAPILVAATMIVLFEGTLLLTKWTGRE